MVKKNEAKHVDENVEKCIKKQSHNLQTMGRTIFQIISTRTHLFNGGCMEYPVNISFSCF